jgi:hypothetical protein
MKQKFRLIKAAGVVAVVAIPSFAFAQAAAVTVSSVTSTLATSMITAMGDIITGVSPLLALGFGIAAAVRWVKKGSKAT